MFNHIICGIYLIVSPHIYEARENIYMDFEQLLPLLGGDEKAAAPMKSAGGDKKALLSAIVENNTEAVKVLGLMSALESKSPPARKKSEGLNEISDFAPNDIIGTLFKLLR